MSWPLSLVLQWPSWTLWIGAAVIFGILEITLPYFGLILASLAALICAMASFWGLSPSQQLIVFSGVLLLELALLRPWLVRRLQSRQKTIPSRAHALLGEQGQVTEPFDPITRMGRVLVREQDWAARLQGESSPTPNSTPIRNIKIVKVIGDDGIVLLVTDLNLNHGTDVRESKSQN